jgi:hypothetical protein
MFIVQSVLLMCGHANIYSVTGSCLCRGKAVMLAPQLKGLLVSLYAELYSYLRHKENGT